MWFDLWFKTCILARNRRKQLLSMLRKSKYDLLTFSPACINSNMQAHVSLTRTHVHMHNYPNSSLPLSLMEKLTTNNVCGIIHILFTLLLEGLMSLILMGSITTMLTIHNSSYCSFALSFNGKVNKSTIHSAIHYTIHKNFIFLMI